MKIISLNLGEPALMEWQGKSIVSSMLRHAVPGPLQVHLDHIDGDKFANPQAHGNIDAVLYAYGMTSVMEFMMALGRTDYAPGALGENVTLDALDEKQV